MYVLAANIVLLCLIPFLEFTRCAKKPLVVGNNKFILHVCNWNYNHCLAIGTVSVISHDI